MDGPVDVPYAEIERMMSDLEATARGEGIGDGNERFIIQRYVSKSTGAIYDCLFAGTEAPKCALIPPTDNAPGDPSGTK
jgi:hypothetical protein